MRWPWSRETPEKLEEAPAPRCVCRTCGTSGPFYAAHQSVSWHRITEPYRSPTGELTYRLTAIMLPRGLGPALAYYCNHCGASCNTLEELVLEPALHATRGEVSDARH